MWFYALTISFSLKNSEMHQMAERATITYTILLIIAADPPKINATRSNWKIPNRPQLIPPIINKINAILSNILLFLPSVLYTLSCKIIIDYYFCFIQKFFYKFIDIWKLI